MKRLRMMQEVHGRIGDVRGLGLMIGIEFVREGAPDPDGLKDILGRCRKKGLVLLECGVDKNIIRLAPPLITTGQEMERGLSIIDECLREAGAQG